MTFNTQQGFSLCSSPSKLPINDSDGVFFTSTPLNKGVPLNNIIRIGGNDGDNIPITASQITKRQSPKKGGNARRTLNMKNSFYHDSRIKYVEKSSKNNNKEEALDQEILYLQTINQIYALEKDISGLIDVTKWGRQQPGYIGSVPHIAAAKKLLIANLTKDALIESIAKNYFFPPSQRINCPKGEIVVDNLLVESNSYIGDHERLPPCYIIVVNHGTTILSTDLLAPDCHGKVEFPVSMVFENINHDFYMKISLYKLEVSSSLSNNVPMNLIGEKMVSNRNLNTTTVFGRGEIAYINLNYSLDTGRGPLQGQLVVKKIVRKNFRETKAISKSVWGVLRRTDLSIYEEAKCPKPINILRMTRCKSCQPWHGTPRTIVLDMVESHSSSRLYLGFDDEVDFQEWLKAISFAVWVSKKWQY